MSDVESRLRRYDKDDFKSKLGIVELVLIVDWDPIGVFGIPDAVDEYDRYAPQLLRVAESGGTPQEISAYLRNIEVEMMGLGRQGTSDEVRLSAAKKILEALGLFVQYEASTRRNTPDELASGGSE